MAESPEVQPTPEPKPKAKPEVKPDPTLVPMKPPEAKELARSIVRSGTVEFSAHAQGAMKDDGLETTDILNLIRAGVFDPPELEKGELRYRSSTARMAVVFVFRSPDRIRVVTAWRKR